MYAEASTPYWATRAFSIELGPRILDTHEHDSGGHAAPFVVDLDQDGRPDLVIGSLSGRFRYYRNVGSDIEPRFESSDWLATDREPARVPNWCCMAAAPQFVDLDSDGVLDLTAGSYGGPIYWLKGLGGLRFGDPLQLLSVDGATLLAQPETFWSATRASSQARDGRVDSFAANVAWMDWFNKKPLDMIHGNHFGQLFVWKGYATQHGYTSTNFGPPGLAQFRRVSVGPVQAASNEILIDGKMVLPDGDYHAAPAVADWDGDGISDILVASKSGNVYFLRNTGEPGAPEFKTRELILEGGQGIQLLEAGVAPQFGIRTHVHVADYNSDGKPDLLVGCFAASITPRPDLNAAKREDLQRLWRELELVDEQIGNKHRELPDKFEPYFRTENKAIRNRYNQLREKMRSYLVTNTIRTSSGRDYETDVTYHGNVWVFLRK